MSSIRNLIQRKKHIHDYGRVTKDNKNKVLNYMRKIGKDYDIKFSSKDSIREITTKKNQLLDEMNYEIMSRSINEGLYLVAESEGNEIKKNKKAAKDTLKLAKWGKDLAFEKNKLIKKLKNVDSEKLEHGNFNINGFGNMDIISQFENLKSDEEIKNYLKRLDESEPREEVYNNTRVMLSRVFQKIGIVRESDLDKVYDKLKTMSFDKMLQQSNILLESLELYGSDQLIQNETELANARLDDMMIKLGIKKTGKAKVKKVLKKYSS